MVAKIHQFVKPSGHDLFVGACLILVAYISYNLGLAQRVIPKSAAILPESSVLPSQKTIFKPTATPKPKDPRVVASKNSKTKSYYYSWCTNRIKAENQVWFGTEIEAQKAGYTLAGN